MVPPSVVIKDSMGGQRFARSFCWSAATERLVNAIFVVINSELFQLAHTRSRGDQVGPVRTRVPSVCGRLIGTIRREFLDHVLIWNAIDLERKLEEFRTYYNDNRVHQSLNGSTPGERSGKPPPARAVLDHYAWRHHCRGLFQMPIAA